MDWQRGKIPFFTLPPDYKEGEDDTPLPLTTTSTQPTDQVNATTAAEQGVEGDVAAANAARAVADAAPLPVPAEAVTEEDAAREAGAGPEEAAAGECLHSHASATAPMLYFLQYLDLCARCHHHQNPCGTSSSHSG